MNIQYYGHSCFRVESGGKHILFDPFIRPNPLAKEVVVEDIPADYVLISHGHGDHIADAVEIAQRTGATVVSNYEIIQWLAKQGVEKGHPMNFGGKKAFAFGTVHSVLALHSSSFPDGTYAGGAGGFVVETAEATFYFSGDTALYSDMKLIGEKFSIDFAFICVGDNFTMGYEDAAIAAEYLNCDHVIGMHFDTFGYIEINHQAAKDAFAQKGKQLQLPTVGQILELNFN